MRLRAQLLITSCAFLLSGLTACVNPAPAMRNERTAVISGRETAGYSQDDAVKKDLVLAAKMTVDHGFRYFRIVDPSRQNGRTGSIRPGADVVITVFHEGEATAQTAGIWDAEEILTTGVPSGVTVPVSSPLMPSSPHTPTGAPAPNSPTPRCTAYGCNW